jgi:hypothetical protein
MFVNFSIAGFLQVFFVSINAYCIAHGIVVWLIASSFCISYLWSHNVKKVAFGGESDRVLYALGACVGCLCGYYVATHLSRLGA